MIKNRIPLIRLGYLRSHKERNHKPCIGSGTSDIITSDVDDVMVNIEECYHNENNGPFTRSQPGGGSH